MRTHQWRMSQEEMDTRIIVRALRRDIPNGGHAYGPRIKWLADKIEKGEIVFIEGVAAAGRMPIKNETSIALAADIAS